MGGKTKQVLLLDDDQDQLFLLEAMLQRESYSVTSAHDPGEALQKISAEAFDIVITDIAMPNMNGLEFANEVRQIPGREGLPIVLITAGLEPIDFSSHHFRANAFCLKRNLKESLLPTIRKLLRQEGQDAEPS